MTEKPAEYTLEEIGVGEKRKFTITITESMLNDFAKISGDYNPLHMDEKYSSMTSFKRRVAHGMLLASFFSRLVGMYLPGKNALYFSQSLNFKLPCFINDEITVEGEVLEKHMVTRIITLKTTIYNQDSKCVIDGVGKVLVRK